MKDIEERVIRNEESANSAHKRLDDQARELIIVKDAWHKHAGRMHTVEGILLGISTSVDKWTISTNLNTQTLSEFKAIAKTAIFMGSIFIAFCGFVGGQLMNWW